MNKDGDLFETKKYLLDHVLYEMEMYLYTYACLHQLKFTDQLMFNTYWNSQKIALRNLMDFFGLSGSTGKDEIKYRFFSFPDSKDKRRQYSEYYKAISSAINHITIHRVTGLNNKMLDEIVYEAQEYLYPIICGYIKVFLKHLCDDEIITYTHDGQSRDIKAELKDVRIASLVTSVEKMLINGNGYSSESISLFCACRGGRRYCR